MALSYEKNTDLAFDTDAIRDCGKRYGAIAKELQSMADQLDKCLQELIDSGWTTPAGKKFKKMVNTDWSENIKKYTGLLETLEDILESAATEYDDLVDQVERTKLP
ncbi:WXG100 family type VII secretion target [Niallia sp. Krafla_26]|uniref:WXG100 family type VII secretion target n=1 Tax=Niallia sp. Krafla_26 TaxID=3064703 RepID=UPI003D16F752